MRTIEYIFEFDGRAPWRYTISFDDDGRYIPQSAGTARPWTSLDFNKCDHCPLKKQDSPQCPVARNLDQIVEDSKDAVSFTKAKVTVHTPERTYMKECATQEGLRSLFGVVMAASGCPHLDWLRPLSRFHLPFADIEESVFRVLSQELLRSYFQTPTASMTSCAKRIEDQYAQVQRVNHGFMGRIRSYCRADADKNAIAALDAYAQLFSFKKDAQFDTLRRYFA